MSLYINKEPLKDSDTNYFDISGLSRIMIDKIQTITITQRVAPELHALRGTGCGSSF